MIFLSFADATKWPEKINLLIFCSLPAYRNSQNGFPPPSYLQPCSFKSLLFNMQYFPSWKETLVSFNVASPSSGIIEISF